ncbi:glutathione S-transferase family protein [Jannaschia aquimarina]|uniref:YibF protein n=1 Tax=Jannaschia aquimarina TaxID=935700 RepID=A0A0D1EB78_9RHOB|nr:glutathione S-transferase family protein [Jannaschia aquimarina]KIT15009.1 putative GST-like protein YibF [Jannaschia aquimarina]SNS61860.1 glutathione S-transferase [Jannaschia aquimarina]
MQLLSSGASPFARTCRVLLIETAQDDVEIVDVTASPMGGDASLNAANPSGKIPALLREDGPAIYDSRVICRFLDQRAGSGLYPESRLWEILSLEANAHAVMEAAIAITYEKRLRPEALWWPDWFDAQWAKIARSLDAMEARSMPLLEGPLNMAQVAVGCALGYLDLRHDGRAWRTGRDTLKAWEARFAERPSMQATRPAP